MRLGSSQRGLGDHSSHRGLALTFLNCLTLNKKPFGNDWLLNHQVLAAPDLLGEGTQGSLILNFLQVSIPIILDLILAEEEAQSAEMPFSQGLLVGDSGHFRTGMADRLRVASQAQGRLGRTLRIGSRSPGFSLTLFWAGTGPGPQPRSI